MNKEESLSFLQSCIDKVNLATAQDIQFYREMYDKDCAMPITESDKGGGARQRNDNWAN